MTYSIEQRDAELVGTTAAIRYHLFFDKAPRHLVRIRMQIDAITGDTVEVVMPSWAPGSYKIRDYAGWQGNVEVVTIHGAERRAATASWVNKAALRIDTAGAERVEIDYVVYANERTVRTNHVNRHHAFLMPVAMLMYVEGRRQEVHHVVLHHDEALWPTVTTALSPVAPGSPGPAILGALNYDILADSPIEIGRHLVRSFTAAGARHDLSVASSHSIDIDWLVEQLTTIVETEARIFDGVPYDRYVFMIQAYPGIYGGLEHARSSVNAVDPSTFLDRSKTTSMLSLLCHEYFHLWNVKRIRPVELGPFDYTRETPTTMLWLAEGITSYYDDLLAYRCGFLTEREFVGVLGKEHLGRLAQVPGRFRMSVRDSSYLAWLKLYMQSADANNRFPSYYLKGGVIALLLDLYILDHTDGKRNLDHALRALWERYGSLPSQGMDEQECIAIMERGTGVQFRDLLLEWLSGTDELPYDRLLPMVGLRIDSEREPSKAITFGQDRDFARVPSAVYCGWSVREDGGRLIVRTVDDGTPADAAGIGIDDEVVAVNGRRVATTALLDQYLAQEAAQPVVLTMQCDGLLYTTAVEPIPVPEFRLVDVPSMSSRQNLLRTAWLRR